MSQEILAQQSASAEIEAHTLPDLMAEYADEEMSFLSFNGTPEELLKLCPVPHDQMTLEAKNTFLINIMNASGASIKEEHVPYVMEVLTASNQEFNLQVRAVEPVQESESTRKESNVMFEESVVAKSSLKPAVDIPTSIVADKYEVTPEIETPEVASDTALMTAEHMNRWLQEVQAEYEQEHRQALVLSEVEPDAEKAPRIMRDVPTPVIGTSEELSLTVVDTQADPDIPTAIALPEFNMSQAAEDVTIVQEEVSAATPPDRLGAAEGPSLGQELETPELPVIEVKNEASAVPAERSLPVTEMSALSELFTPEVSDGSSVDGSEEATITEETFEQKLTEVRDILDTLTLTEMIHIDEDEDGEVRAAAEVAQEARDGEFIQRFAASIQALPEKPHTPTAEQPRVILDAVLSTALKVQETLQMEGISSEVIEELKEELETLAKQLFESMGIEVDEDTVARFIEKILAGDLSNIPHKKLTPQELARLGTHEYKLEEWFHKFKQLLDNALHPHQVMGRVALNLASVTF